LASTCEATCHQHTEEIITTGIQLIYILSKDIEVYEVKLDGRYAPATVVPNTRELHCFIPTEPIKLGSSVSSSMEYTVVSVSKDVPFKITAVETKENWRLCFPCL
jgi:hypothetical protein